MRSKQFTLATIALIALSMVGACSGSRQLADQSTSDVLVPVDDKFRREWMLLVRDSPNNYTFRSHWSPSFNPDIDRNLTVIGHQVNDPSVWSGGDETGDGLPEKEAVRMAVDDSLSPSPDGPCTIVNSELQLVQCEYDVDHLEGRPLTILVRRFSDVPTVMMAILGITHEAEIDYMSGEFESVPIEDAIDAWLDY
ncbi:MAG: hypothetical protein GY926_05935 [bacterium]|nr:hypothetical protein [bacterium]